MKQCSLCNKEFDENSDLSLYAEAGEWLANEEWNDPGELCPLCLENRAKLVMMYYPRYQ